MTLLWVSKILRASIKIILMVMSIALFDLISRAQAVEESFNPAPLIPSIAKDKINAGNLESCEWPEELRGSPTHQTKEQSKRNYRLDWVPFDDLTAEQAKNIRRSCDGAYLEPFNSAPEATKNPEQSHIVLHSDHIAVDKDNTAHLSGEVQLNQGYRSVSAENILYYKSRNSAEIKGNIEFREPGLYLIGHDATIDLNAGSAILHDGSYLIHKTGVRGGASVIEKTADNRFILEDGYYTRCSPQDPIWNLQTSSLELDNNTGYGTAKHVRLKVKDVPILYAPYLKFPIDGQRHSGLLFPTIGSTSNNGIDFAIPYYFNLAPNYDATYTPRYMNDRGYMNEGEVRYLDTYQTFAVGATYLHTDPVANENNVPTSANDENRDRWLFTMDQLGGLNQPWGTQIDYTVVSDDNYFRDLSVTALDVKKKTALKKMAELNYKFADWSLATKFEEYQVIARDIEAPYKLLPEVVLESYQQDKDTLLTFDFVAIYSHFNHENSFNEIMFPQYKVDGQRIHAEPTLSWPHEWTAGFFTPMLKIYQTNYDLERPYLETTATINTDAYPARTIPSASLDAGLFLEREMSLNNSRYLQTLEPRLFYLYNGYENQDKIPLFDTALQPFSYASLFRHNRYNGYDRIGDENRVALSLTSRVVAQSTGKERLRASIGQIYHLQDRKVALASVNFADQSTSIIEEASDVSTSPLAAELWAPITEQLTTNTSLVWDSREDQMDKTRIDVRYDFEHHLIVNIGYQFTRSILATTESESENVLIGKKWAVREVLDRSEISSGAIANIDGIPIDPDYFQANYPINNMFCFDSVGDVMLPSERCAAPPSTLVNDDLEQADFSFVLPIKNNWALINRWNYDLTHHRSLDLISGVEYNDCCWKVQFFARRELDDRTSNELVSDYDNGVFFSFQFKGLAGAGGGVGGALEDYIVGYKQRELNDQ